MADAIGELGLDTSQAEAATQRFVNQLVDLGKEAAVVTGNLLGMAAVVGGTLAVGIYNSRQRAKELNEELRAIKAANPFATASNDVATLEGKIKSLNAEIKKMDDEGIGERIFRFIGSAHLLGGQGFDASESQQEAMRASAARAIEEAMLRIGKREEKNLEILRLQVAGENEKSDILKNQLEWQQKIDKAADAGNATQAAALARERNITEELIKQKYLRERREAANSAISAQAEDAAKQFFDEEANKRKIQDEAGKKEDKKYEEEQKAAREEEAEDNQHLYELEQQRTAEAAKRRVHNENINKDLRDEVEIEEVRRRQGDLAAERRKSDLDFQRKINEAIRDGNVEGEKLLRQQQGTANRAFDRRSANQTPAEHRAEVAAVRRNERQDRNASRRLADLDDRIARGARGSENSRLEQRRRENEARAKRGADQEARRGNVPPNETGFGQKDSANIQIIADALSKTD